MYFLKIQQKCHSCCILCINLNYFIDCNNSHFSHNVITMYLKSLNLNRISDCKIESVIAETKLVKISKFCYSIKNYFFCLKFKYSHEFLLLILRTICVLS